MICREDGDRWILIAQPAHARFAAELAARWTARPLAPRRSVLHAIGHHDDGWIDWERAPRADPGTGRPVDFLSTTAFEHLDIWRRGPMLVAARDPYAGILVSRHGSALTSMALAGRARSPGERAALEAYLREQETLRTVLAREPRLAAPGEGEKLEENVRLLQVLDLLSLVLCCGPAEARDVGPLSLEPRGERDVALAPWPFDGDGALRFEVEGRRVAKTRYDDGSLARALAAARVEALDFTLRPPASDSGPPPRS